MMAEHVDLPVVKIYPNRAFTLIFAIILGAVCYFVVFGYMLNGTTPLTANPWEYQEPVKIIMGLFCAVLFGGASLLMLYFTVTPIPLLAFDSQGMSYQLPPFKHGAIRWEDTSAIWAGRSVGYAVGSGWRLSIHVMLKSELVPIRSKERQITLSVSERMLSINAQEVVRRMRHFHRVQVVGKHWGKLRGDERAPHHDAV